MITLLGLLSGCFTVHAVNNPEDVQCNLVTKELEVRFSGELSNFYLDSNSRHNHINTSDEMMVLLVAVPAASLIVSGSVSVIGNVVHWVEKQGRCEDSAVRTFTSSINDGIVATGGLIVNSPKTLLQWLQGEDISEGSENDTQE